MWTCSGRLLCKGDGSPIGCVLVMEASHLRCQMKQFFREHRDTSAENCFLEQPTHRIATTARVQTSIVKVVRITGCGLTPFRPTVYDMVGKSAAHEAEAVLFVLSSAAVPLHELAQLRQDACRVAALVLAP